MKEKLCANFAGNWKLYTNIIPEGFEVLGTITRNDFDTGALLQNKNTGIYVQCNAGAIRSLPQPQIIHIADKEII